MHHWLSHVADAFAALAEDVKSCGAEALALLEQLKDQESLGTADSAKLRAALGNVKATAEVSVPSHTPHTEDVHALRS